MLIYPAMVASYPSSWQVYLDILRCNSLADYHALQVFVLGNPSQETWWNCSGSLHYLSAELGMSPVELKPSFVDGWFPVPKPYEHDLTSQRGRVQIRHCPQCIKYGYHSVVFYFGVVTHCPWHGDALERCEQCSMILDQQWGMQKGIYNAENLCEHIPIILRVAKNDPLPPDLAGVIQTWCNTFFTWVQRGHELLGETAYDVVAVNHACALQDVQVALGYLVERLGVPGFTARQSESTVVFRNTHPKTLRSETFAAYAGCNNELMSAGSRVISSTQMRAVVRALRRYLFRVYVKPHRSCLKKLKKLGKVEWVRMDARAICPGVLAYALVCAKYWQVPPYYFFRNACSYDCTVGFKQRTINSNNGGIGSSFELDAVSVLRSFYEVLDGLANYEKTGAECIMFSSQFFCSKRICRYSGIFEIGRNRGLPVREGAYLFMKNPEVLASVCRKCQSPHRLVIDSDEVELRTLDRHTIYCAIYNFSKGASGSCDFYI